VLIIVNGKKRDKTGLRCQRFSKLADHARRVKPALEKKSVEGVIMKPSGKFPRRTLDP
jgi:hypothetical protein